MRREHVAAAGFFVILSIVMTWPLAPNLGRAVADNGDPLIVIWVLDWDWWATFYAPLSLFHANTFHPARYSLAYSENLYGIALLLFPLRAAGVSAIEAYNIAMLAGFAFCGYAAWLLGRRLTGSFVAGLAAGVFYAFVPFRFIHLPHLQHVWGGWLPLLLVALLAYAEKPAWRRAALFAAIFGMNGLTNVHYLFFGGLATAVTAVILLPREQWRRLLVALVAALAILAPFLYPYLIVAKLYGMQRSWEEVSRFSAVLQDWLPGASEPERMLYPGGLSLLLAAAGLVASRRAWPKAALALLWVALGVLGSLGLNFVFHEFLYGAVPGFRAIRAPARWAVIAYIGMSVLIALFTAILARRNRWVALIVPVVLAISLWRAPIRWYLLDPQPAPVYGWLATQDATAIAELPMDALDSEYAYMLAATTHRKRTINGISGFAPPQRVELSRLANENSPGDGFIDALRSAGVELLVVHADRYGENAVGVQQWLRRELARKRLRFAGRFDAKLTSDWVFALDGGRGGPLPRDLDVYLAGGVVCTTGTSGLLEAPAGEVQGAARFAGWASSPDGIATVDVWLANRRIRHQARIIPTSERRCPGPPPVRYELLLPFRPAGVRQETDVLIEITDRRGRTHRLEHRWFTWAS